MSTSTLRVLLVDDCELDGEILRRMLARGVEGAEMTQCFTPDEAREALVEQSFDVLFLDNYLGASTGLELLSELRASDFQGPVVYFTGLLDERLAAPLRELGCNVVLDKGSITPESLTDSILAAREGA